MPGTPFHFPFNERKALEATAAILRLAGGVLDRFHLVKCIYFAERESLARRGRPICGGHYSNMPHGPVPKDVYVRITGYGRASVWAHYIQPGEEHDIHLVTDVAPSALSEADLSLLQESFEKFGRMPFPDLWRLVHDRTSVPEYRPPSEVNETPLTVDAVLEGIGRSAEEIDRIRRDVVEESALDELLPEVTI